jgi:hypothetical protein
MALGRERLRHLVLLELVAREDDQLARLELGADHLDEGAAERAGAAGDQHHLAVQVGPRLAEVARDGERRQGFGAGGGREPT